MHSGLGRIGRTGVLTVLLLPPVLVVVVRGGAHAYCARAARSDESRCRLLADLPDMERAVAQAQVALQSVRAEPPGEPGRAEECGRWLLDVAKSQRVELHGLAIAPIASDPLTPALCAEFNFEQDLIATIGLLQSLRDAPYVVIFETLKLRLAGPQEPVRYRVEARLRAHTIVTLNALPPGGALAAVAPTAPPADADSRLAATVSGYAAAIMRRNRDTRALSEPLFPPPAPLPPPAETNLLPVEIPEPAPAPVTANPPPTYQLTAIFSQRAPAQALARLNGRLIAEGDSVSNGLRVAKIGSDYVVLTDTQGVRRVIGLFGR